MDYSCLFLILVVFEEEFFRSHKLHERTLFLSLCGSAALREDLRKRERILAGYILRHYFL
jgi:hypothetical protein